MIAPKSEAQIIDEAVSCGEQLLEALSERPTGRVSDIADLAFAYHLARALLLRDTQITNGERLATIRIVDAVAEPRGRTSGKSIAGVWTFERN